MYQRRPAVLCAVGNRDGDRNDRQTDAHPWPVSHVFRQRGQAGRCRAAVVPERADRRPDEVDRKLGLRWRAIYLGVHYLIFHTIGFGPVAIWYVAGWWAWQALARRLAARKVAAGGAGVTAIPLDQVTSVQCKKARKGASWLGMRTMTVTAADGTEYTFDGLMEQWHAHLATALTAQGREVHVAPETITVMPWATLGEN
jgi:hypothetical protein